MLGIAPIGVLDAVLWHAAVQEDAETLIIDDVYHVEVYEAMAKRWPHLRFVRVNVPRSVQHSMLRSDPSANAVAADRHELDEGHPPRAAGLPEPGLRSCCSRGRARADCARS